uniref:Uncharacterized protein LOC111117800 n=1 Tax=Crassostrea virginica TaxID=6565 RepID=A0A8B8CAF6_CRAVI|nr:uncharacterized protein LOC111117800 [Crassostrea virginica]
MKTLTTLFSVRSPGMARKNKRLQLLICVTLIFGICQMINSKWNFLNLRNYLDQPITVHEEKTHRRQDDKTRYHGYPLASKSSIHPDLRIIVVVYNRPHSLERLLNSLNEANYFKDKVQLDVWIDRSKKDGSIHYGTYYTASQFRFLHGGYKIHNHTQHVGIYGQWIGTWNPAPESSEIAVILEDDLTVSKHFYRWLKNVHKKYDGRTDVAGYALQGRSIKHGGAAGNLRGPDNDVCFLYPILGTWGFSPHRESWRHFVEWYQTASRDPTFQPLVPGILPTQWWQVFQKQGKVDGMWSMWHIYHAWNNKLWTLYPNLPDSRGLTISWREAGLHYKGGNSPADPLLQEWEPAYNDLPGTPAKLDVNGKVISVKIR